MTKVAIVYHSGYGHTAKLAEAVEEGVRRAGVDAVLLKADDLTKPDEGPWDELNSADAIIFGAPTYMGSASATFKAFQDATSKVWMTQGWADKLAAGFTNSGSVSGDKLQTLQQFAILAAQHGMVWVGLGVPSGFNMKEHRWDDATNRGGYWLGVGAHSPVDTSPEEAPVACELETGRLLGERVAKSAIRWTQTA
ncbi:MAG: NADPH-dependent FMN reductase [Ponticaulis sp.]|nr:NADPH-dependent FMN reductase [Ponticaulis sp.]|tara:strand:- start:1841 stop:2425 length:585 start_codon:yes stop_codon:yes gene_type:complete